MLILFISVKKKPVQEKGLGLDKPCHQNKNVITRNKQKVIYRALYLEAAVDCFVLQTLRVPGVRWQLFYRPY